MTISGDGSSREDSRGKNMTIGMIADITKVKTNDFYVVPANDALGGSETEVSTAPPQLRSTPRRSRRCASEEKGTRLAT